MVAMRLSSGRNPASHRLFRILLWGPVILLLSVIVALTQRPAQAQDVSINTARDCNANAVVWCGADSVTQLVGKYRGGDGLNTADSIHDIFSAFGISAADINGMNTPATTVEAGQVTRAGDVFDGDGKLVATGAMTAGRDKLGGGTREVSGGTVFFVRPPSLAFTSDKLAAFVVMVNGKFSFAILASCGNPVKATPKMAPPPPPPAMKHASTPKATPVAPAQPVTTTSICSGNTTNTATNSGTGGSAQGGNCSTNVVNNTTNNTTPPASPMGQCSSLLLTVSPNDPHTIMASVSFQVPSGVQLQSITYDFGDGTVTAPTAQTVVSHTYQQAGTFVVKATPAFSGAVTAASTACEASVTIAASMPACDSLGLNQGDNRTVVINNFQTTANGGTFTGADIDWGDGNTTPGVMNPVGQTHQYQADGTFTVSVIAHFQVNGQMVTAGGAACQQQISFVTPASPAPTPTPPAQPQATTPMASSVTPAPTTTVTATPAAPAVAPASQAPATTLVNTGAGDVAGVFSVATVAGVLGYRYWLSRRLRPTE